MTERIRVSQVLSAIRKLRPAWVVHKEGDTFGGHKKPFDCWILAEGRFFAIEFKRGAGSVMAHQAESLTRILCAKGQAWVVFLDCDDEIPIVTNGLPTVSFTPKTSTGKIASNIIRLVESCINYN